MGTVEGVVRAHTLCLGTLNKASEPPEANTAIVETHYCFYARVLPGHVFPQAAKFQYPCLAGLQFLARISPSLVNILESFSLSTKMFILRSKRD